MFILCGIEISCIFILLNSMDNRFNNKTFTKTVIIIFLSLLSVIFNKNDFTLGFIMNYIIAFIIIVMIFRISIKEMIVEFLFAFGIIIGVQILGTYIFTLLYIEMNYSFINGLIINIITLISCIIISKFTIFKKVRNILDTKYKIYIMVFLNITFGIMLFLYVWQMYKNLIWDYNFFSLAIIFLWISINFFILYQTIRIKEQQEKLYIHEKYMPFLIELIEEARRKQHDYANHLNTIFGLTELEDSKSCKNEIRKYLKGLIKDFKSLDKILGISEPVLSAIIYSKRALAESKDIRFQLNIQSIIPNYPIEGYELVDILGNLLDNAIEAVDNLDSEHEREILLVLGIEEGKKLIEVRNTGETIESKNMESIFDKGFSTKEGKHRGYGLYNVKKIINRYNSTIELSLSNKYTILKILFY